MDHKKKSDFQPRGADRKKKKRRPIRNRIQPDTFGQNVQKPDEDRTAKPETAFSAGQETFSRQSEPGGEENSERKQNAESDIGDYHRRDTYRPSRKTGNYHKKRAQKKRRGSNESRAEAVGEGFSQTQREESFADTGNADFHKTEADTEISGSRKLKKRKRQAERAGRKLERARAKLPKERDYTFQRVYITEMMDKMPDIEAHGALEKWQAIYLATEIDELSYQYDPEEYRREVANRGAEIVNIAEDIRAGNTEYLHNFLNALVSESIRMGITDVFSQGVELDNSKAVQTARKAQELLDKLAEYKPLAKVEELEEQNYNMVDNVLNNGAGEKRQEQPGNRISVKEKLAEKKAAVGQREKLERDLPKKEAEKRAQRDI